MISIDNIEFKKELSKRVYEARKRLRPKRCLLCDKEITNLCNSHSVPQFVLKNLAENGKIVQSTMLMSFEDIDFFDIEKGINNSGTFKYICDNCDNTFFKDYESEEALLGDITDKMLAEIALKDELLNVAKRSQEKELYKQMEDRIFGIDMLMEQHDLDLRDFHFDIELHKKEIIDNSKGAYQIIYKELLPYVVPIATQVSVTLKYDMYGYPVNDIYDFSPDVRMEGLHLVIFPLKKQTLVLTFYHKKNKKYRSLRHQFNSEDSNKVKEFLNYILFAYTEHYFLSKQISERILQHDKLIQLSKEIFQRPKFSRTIQPNYVPVKPDEIPNLLSKEWAIGE